MAYVVFPCQVAIVSSTIVLVTATVLAFAGLAVFVAAAAVVVAEAVAAVAGLRRAIRRGRCFVGCWRSTGQRDCFPVAAVAETA